jgi:hypothetical protein
MLGISLLILLIVSGSDPLGDARFTGKYDLLPSGILRAGLRIVGMIRYFAEHASKLYRYAASSTSALANIKRGLEQASAGEIARAEIPPKTVAASRWKADQLVPAIPQIQQQVLPSIASLCEKVVRSAVGVRPSTHTTTLELVYPEAIRTALYVQPSPPLGTA